MAPTNSSTPSALPTILEEIVATRRTHLDDIRDRIAHVDPATLPLSERSLEEGLAQRGRGGAAFIMECKSASPSLGLIRSEYNPGAIARIYSRFAVGISVLCEPARFGGDYDHLSTVAASTHLPVLCKDFIIDECQIIAARYFGADAILLMLSILSDEQYRHLAAVAARYNLDILTEVIDEEEVVRAQKLGARIFGVNHRNLHDLSIDLSRSAALGKLIGDDAILVAESGIRDNHTVRTLSAHANGFLVGSQLTSQPDVDLAARMLVYGANKVCGITSPEVAQGVRSMGAVYGGLIFEETSPRNVSRETAQKIIHAEPDLHYVAVSRRTENFHELAMPGIHAVQLHAPLCASIEEELKLIDAARRDLDRAGFPDIRLWRAISMTKPNGPFIAQQLVGRVDKLVLDAGEGGSGETFDWTLISDEIKQHSFIAGGLNLDNLDEALAVGAYGLDVNSGVEYPDHSHRHHTKDLGLVAHAFARIRSFHYTPSKKTGA
ncbi:MAG: bifunctional indole-3-glycerol-phosphate synthase TrpC/phosphoribosylanthranilate isomerase TrpF [Corynebacterium sp.]|uniref:bifunctional indole-3-glycerol-phosphate synthase TrpC/phosphoribosylanthranilate isomerase TrpF n=1 Tax=Corynebacterium sp. TaxID=1720 RepID=UPI0026DB7102|nr:bifunctional indole-3-glycerol-phosphate synthase TrpC/phosphoribosylanthranilate isomerase TrpF [Corynebacterium sp.]MDO4761688.1 bifunctional indole-3-glycerol-phosphate synthase TrpC/phosphoribosylanthranilate isomerase TrpF [Corynebacterium sp.]